MPCHEISQFLFQNSLQRLFALLAVFHRCCDRIEPLRVRPVCTEGSCFDQIPADQEVHRHILIGGDSLAHIPLPGPKVIDPGGHRVRVEALMPDLEGGTPPIVLHEDQRHIRPMLFAFMPVPNHAGNLIMAVGEHVRLHHHRLPHHPLDWEPATVNFRTKPFDHDTAAPVNAGNSGDGAILHILFFLLLWLFHLKDSYLPISESVDLTIF